MLKISIFNKIIVANWKVNGEKSFLRPYFEKLVSLSYDSKTCGIVCPPSIYINECSKEIETLPLFLGAQNCSKFDNGAYTGEISTSMLKNNNCSFCIIGHSERRAFFSETNNDVNIKAEKLINHNINPIICIGETIEQKKQGITREILRDQIHESMPKNANIHNVILAYEPIWAIGSGMTPTLEEIDSIHYFIKNKIVDYEGYKVIYGGSVKSKNSNEIMELDNVDGVLVGGASLDPIEYSKILIS